MDHRCGKRYQLSYKVHIKTIKGQFENSKTRDISIDGMSIEHHENQLQVNEVIHMRLTSGENARQQYKLKGMVVHRSNNLAGIIFLRDYSVYINELLQRKNGTASLEQNQYSKENTGHLFTEIKYKA